MKYLMIATLLCVGSVLFADSKDSVKPLNSEQPAATSEPVPDTVANRDLEAKYRKALEERLDQEKEDYAASLNNLWMANAAVWAVLVLFVVYQLLRANKLASELARIKSDNRS